MSFGDVALQRSIGLGQLDGPFLDPPLELIVRLLGLGLGGFLVRLLRRDVTHLADTPADRDKQKNVGEDDPADMLQPLPRIHDGGAVDGLRPKSATYRVIQRRHQRRRERHTSVSVEGRKCEPKTWQCVSRRPPVRWISSPDISICPTAITCCVRT